MGFFDTVIVQPVFNLLLSIYSLVGDFGVAIIIFTAIVKFAMWPLVKKQLHQSKLMKKIQPELAEIKKSCKGNRQMESLQMMDLYKRNNIKPFRSMLVLLIQFPVFIALYRVISMAMNSGADVEKYAYGVVRGFSRVGDLISNFDQFKPTLFGVVDLKSSALPINDWSSAVIFAVVIAAVIVQYKVSRQQMPVNNNPKRKFKDIMKEAADGKEADQTEINGIVSGQMTKMLPIMMFLVMVGMPGALSFYYFVTNVVTAVQQSIIFKKDEEEMEIMADKKILKELRSVEKIQEATIVENKNKEKITRISASDKKRRRR
jgi:membrane protein insertase, YidC/Oxa1 family, C-terminal domain